MLEAERDKALIDFDAKIVESSSLFTDLFADASQKSVNEINDLISKVKELFDYLSNTDTEDIQEKFGFTKEQLVALKSDPDKLKALSDAIKDLYGDLKNKSPFQSFKRSMNDALEKIRNGDIQNGVIGISEAISQFSPDLKQFGNSIGTLFGDDKIGEDIGLVIDGIEGIGTAAGGVGKILSGDVVGGLMDVVNGAAKAVEAIGTLFGPDGTAYYEKIRGQLEAINKVYESIIANSKEDIFFGGGFASITAASTALDNYHKKVENLQKISQASGRAGSSWKSHSAEWHSNKNVGANNFSKMGQILGKSVRSMYDLYNITGDELYLVQSQMPEAWSKIDGRILENLQSIIDCKDEARELQAALSEALTGISQDAFYNDFINNISDMSKSFDDMCDDFETSLRKSIMAGLVADQYKSRIDALSKS